MSKAKTLPALSRLSPPVALAIALGMTGCPDTQGEFDAFVERWQRANPGVDGATPDGGECAPPDPAALDGQYVFALSAVIQRETPILFLTQVTGLANPPSVQLVFQPLRSADRRTPVGSPVTVGPFPLAADGTLHAELPPLVVSGESNPITGGEIEAQVTLDARLCGGTDFQCGTVTGNVTRPIPLDLAGSTFAMERVQGGVVPAQPFLSCARNQAAPL
jgi:hypothetical protein